MSSYNDETNPFTYSKSQNYFAKTFRQINEVLELSDKDIRLLLIFAILRIADLALTYILYNKRKNLLSIFKKRFKNWDRNI